MLRNKILQRFQDELDKIADAGRLELSAQGHKATGRGIASIEARVTGTADALRGQILANDYLIPVDTGVPRGRIPYSRGSGARTSLYIQGLISWAGVVRPGLSEAERKSFAFAVANVHKQQGMPSRGSYAFSSNGRRKDWIESGLVGAAENLEDRLRLFALVTEFFEGAARQATAA